MKRIVVFCGSSLGDDPDYANQAYRLGKTLALRDMSLVYGGARVGVMGQVAQGVLDHGGRVIGVIPEFLMRKEVYHEGLTELVITKSMHDRKLKMHALSDAIVMLPGGFGTLEEFFEMLTWAQLGLHQHPIGVLNTNGFYDELFAMLRKMMGQGFVKKENFNAITVDGNIDALLNKLTHYTPLPAPYWLNKEKL